MATTATTTRVTATGVLVGAAIPIAVAVLVRVVVRPLVGKRLMRAFEALELPALEGWLALLAKDWEDLDKEMLYSGTVGVISPETRREAFVRFAPPGTRTWKERFAWVPVICTMDVETHHDIVSTLPKPPFTNALRTFMGFNSLIFQTGEKGKAQRKLMNKVFGTHDFERAHAMAMSSTALELRRRALSSESVLVTDMLAEATLNVITMAGFGFQLPADGPARTQIVNDFKTLVALGSSRLAVVPFGTRYLAWKHRASLSRLDKLISAIVDERVDRAADGKADEDLRGKDLLDVMLKVVRDAGLGGEVDGVPTRTWLRDNIYLFLFAGTDTSSISLEWALILLAVHPRVQERVQEELDDVMGTAVSTAAGNLHDAGDDASDVPAFGDIVKLKFLDAVLKEVLRVHPVVLGAPRFLPPDTKEFAGVPLPPGVRSVRLDYALAMRREDLFGAHPNDFIPDRWLLDPAENEVAVRHKDMFAGFGFGFRACIGRNFAMHEMKLFLAVLLRRHTVVPADARQPIPHTSGRSGPTAPPSGSFPLRFVRREFM